MRKETSGKENVPPLVQTTIIIIDYCIAFSFCSVDQAIRLKRTEEIKHKVRDEFKNKLREELKHELRAISGGADGAAAGGPGKGECKGSQPTKGGEDREEDKTDYFELVFECIDTRKNFLNVISLNARNPVEPDIDLVILQALLNGKKKKE